MEREFIAWLRQRAAMGGLPLGLGDDAALLGPLSGGQVIVTSDLLTDHVDFELAVCDPRLVGRKALAVNLSDVAAVAAVPLAAIVSVALPRRSAAALARELYEGLLPLADEFQVSLAGGDTNVWSGDLVISATVLGIPTSRGPLRRRGAQPGDALVVTGHFGGSMLGRHLAFSPRVREALLLHQRYVLHAGTDVSDGLARDVSHIAEESDCGAVLWSGAVPVAPDGRRLAALTPSVDALTHALRDGEDFELALAVPADEAARMLAEQPLSTVQLTQLGQFVAEPGLWLETPDGRRAPLDPGGWEHGEPNQSRR